MNPSFKLMLDTLRRGATSGDVIMDAADDYCQSSLTMPVALDDFMAEFPQTDITRRAPDWWMMYLAIDEVIRGIADGLSDAELEKVFYSSKRGRIRFRPMRQHERWSMKDLYNKLSQSEKDQLLNMVGVASVARIITS